MKILGVRRALLLRKDNTKLGPGIYSFSLPAVATCPGRTPLCESHCYARQGHYHHVNVQTFHRQCLQAARGAWFALRLAAEIKLRRVAVLRLHAAGDFYSPEYTRAILMVVRACPRTRFFLYTRSYRIPEIRRELVKLSRLPNVRVWFSADRDSGLPSSVPANVRVAYMAVDDEEVPQEADLVFRVRRKTVAKHLNGVLVCPVENGTGQHFTCTRCRICFDREPRNFKRTDATVC